LIEALGGIGSFPCWISEAFCATAAGSAGPAPPGATAPCPGAALVPSAPGRPPAPEDPGATGAGGRLMTVLMMVVLWILAKMMLFGGAAT
jgi:hypothetical protein